MRKIVINIIFALFGIAVGISALPILWEMTGLAGIAFINNGYFDGLIGGIIFYLLSFLFVKPIINLNQRIEKYLNSRSPGWIIYGAGFLIGGLVLANVISIPFYMMSNMFSNVIPVILMIVFGWIGFRMGTSRRNDWSNFSITKRNTKNTTEKSEELASEGEVTRRSNKKEYYPYKILDTSVVIDGRIHQLAHTGFLEGKLMIPDFVVHELQLISDSSDNQKRERGRRGLDILNEMKMDKGINYTTTTRDYDNIPEVDMKLLKLAKEIGGAVITNDYNLSKVSEFQNVQVLNINELAKVLKPMVLPGEAMTVKVIKEGTEREQGVAYLEDGTMVVVEEGKYFINKEVEIVVTSALQTDAGKMIFAKPKHSMHGIQEKSSAKENSNNHNGNNNHNNGNRNRNNGNRTSNKNNSRNKRGEHRNGKKVR
ncbi:PIN/TRAM domain-containing protein [Companilactobacillus suantsaicola]|uniref:PIN/TRAM domain-containing protein n=1 Tax=Companilactobacillus suantsaicola TaxID=2487723 RepID=A0A4Z0JKZ5_9LACO|nr:PIN/TRAM domain-containing protein [Companilactobacillus suantsaicola]TGD22473.1 PIN/TRAM domain-containing protein [Companilactobacillus suantsaicola]